MITTDRRRHPLIERVDDIDRDTLVRDYLARNRPVVLSGSSAAWCLRWGIDALRERHGHATIAAEETRAVYVGERALALRPLASIIDAIRDGDTRMRWKGIDFLARVPGIRDELTHDPAPFRRWMPATAHGLRSTLWLAPAQTMSSLHHDGNYDNLNLQVSGRKRWCLFPPSSRAALYGYGSAESPIDPFAPDLVRFPRFTEARPMEAVLEPGDTLLVPKYWWHCVHALEPSVNLATCFSWRGERSAWSVLEGAPLVHRSLTVAAAEMKRHGLVRLANGTRRVWWNVYRRVVPRVVPQPRSSKMIG